MGIVLHARSCATGGEDVVGEVKGVDEVGRETFITELGEGRKRQ